jgi:Domain of unknown function (DUF4279)
MLTGSELTSRLGLEPTDVVEMGTRAPVSGRRQEFTVWSMVSPLSPEAPLDEHLTWLLDTVAPAQDRLSTLVSAGEASARIYATIETHQNRLYSMTFLNDLLRKLADFPGHFWLDVFPGAEKEQGE